MATTTDSTGRWRQIDIVMGRLIAPLPKIRVRRTGHLALTAVEKEKAGQPIAFIAWLAAEGHRS